MIIIIIIIIVIITTVNNENENGSRNQCRDPIDEAFVASYSSSGM